MRVRKERVECLKKVFYVKPLERECSPGEPSLEVWETEDWDGCWGDDAALCSDSSRTITHRKREKVTQVGETQNHDKQGLTT